MLYEHRRVLARIFKVADIAIIILAFNLAYFLRFYSIPKLFQAPIQFSVFIITYCAVWIFISKGMEIYSSKRLINFKKGTNSGSCGNSPKEPSVAVRLSIQK